MARKDRRQVVTSRHAGGELLKASIEFVHRRGIPLEKDIDLPCRLTEWCINNCSTGYYHREWSQLAIRVAGLPGCKVMSITGDAPHFLVSLKTKPNE